MPYKDAAKYRDYHRKQMRRWRKQHRCLNNAEINERLQQLGMSDKAASRIETVSLDDPLIRRVVDRTTYHDWLQEAS